MRLLLVIACSASVLAQQPAFRTETRLVVLNATVHNERGELIAGLDRGAFTVYENGKVQPIAVFTRDDVPVSLGLIIDNSGSMRSSRHAVEAAAHALVQASNPADEVFVVNFADTPRLDVPFTNDLAALAQGLRRIDSIGGTALLDAVALAERYLENGTHDRKVLVVVSDGRDNSSVTSMETVEREAEREAVVIYAMGLSTNSTRPAAHPELHRLSERTGGVAYFPTHPDEISAAALDVARQIRSQYTIAYEPLNRSMDGSYRKIRVAVSSPAHLSVRTRTGYVARRDR